MIKDNKPDEAGRVPASGAAVVRCDCCKLLLELIDILLSGNTNAFDDLVNRHEHYLFDNETYEKIIELRNKLST